MDGVAARSRPSPAVRLVRTRWVVRLRRLLRRARPDPRRRSAAAAGRRRPGRSPAAASAPGRRLAFASARAAVTYTGAAKPLVRAWKERGLRPFASRAARLVAEAVPRPAADVITYIPPDGDRSLRRGHHPAERLATELASALGTRGSPAAPARPARGSADRPAARRAAAERPRRVRGDVAVAERESSWSTTSTRPAPRSTPAAAALRAAGADAVHVVTFARAVR